MEELPKEIVKHIFSFITNGRDQFNVFLTCKRFALLAADVYDPSVNENYLIRQASISGNLQRVRTLMQNPRVDPSDAGNEAIHWASQNGHYEVVKELLKDPRVDPGSWQSYGLRRAAANGNLAVVLLLREDPRVNVAAAGNDALAGAIENGHKLVVKELLKDKRVFADKSFDSMLKLALRTRKDIGDEMNVLYRQYLAQQSAKIPTVKPKPRKYNKHNLYIAGVAVAMIGLFAFHFWRNKN